MLVIAKKLTLFERKGMKKRIAILASGVGSNAQSIIQYFKENSGANVVLIGSNKPDALVLKKAADLGVPSFVFNKSELTSGPVVLNKLLKERVDLIVLAGFLLQIPKSIIRAFPNKIVNIHPALLPKFGGKGMYGKHVHQAVIDANEKESGITVHYVNEFYDDGLVVFQARCIVDENDSITTLAEKIHALERKHYPLIVDKIIQTL